MGINFFLPLGICSRWDNNETRYLLRSLDKNISKYNITVYAQNKPEWLTAPCKEIVRYYPEKLLKKYRGIREYENYFDVLNKLWLFVNTSDCPEDFVYIYDDIILLKPIVSEDIFNVPQCSFTPKMFASNQSSKHGRTMNQSYILSGAKYNFEHHLPLRYNRDNLKSMFNRFPFQDMDIPYSIATLYFNLYPEETYMPALSIKNDYKVGFEGFTDRINVFRQDTIADIESALKGKIWMNYNDDGLFWTPPKYPLQQWIKSNFTKKSKFEL